MKPKYPSIHFIGIKGVAMTALAILAKEQGSKVTGSDIEEEFVTDEILKRNKISWKIGFSEKNIIGKPDLVVVTGAHGGMTNPEAIAVKLKSLNVVMQGQALGMFMEGFKQISVVGCHGKTTTSALIATVLEKAGLSPSFAIGCADIPVLGNPARNGRGKYFIAEADEYVTCPETDPTPRFLWQKPDILLITNIEYDHPDVYENIEKVKEAFSKIINKVTNTGRIIACIDNQNVKDVIKGIPQVITYGKSPAAEYRIQRIYISDCKTTFWLSYMNRELGDFQLQIPGEHNVYNAIGAIIAALEAGISLVKIKEIIPQFSGTKRRFEKIGEVNGVLLYDDYAHHPTEINATLQATKKWFPDKKIFCVFQPHTFSRTQALLPEFSRAFTLADTVIITDIYSSAREKENKNMNPEMLVSEISKFHSQVYYQKDPDKVAHFLSQKSQSGDIILTMGAGDIYKWHREIIKSIRQPADKS